MPQWHMPPDTEQGIAVELRFLRKDGWELIEGPERFELIALAGTLDPETESRMLQLEVWRVAQFVAYAYFVSISRRQLHYRLAALRRRRFRGHHQIGELMCQAIIGCGS